MALNITIQTKGGVDKYPAKAHVRRVAEMLHHTDTGLIVLSATKNVNWPNSDMPAPFRQDRYFYYVTGCNEPDCLATYNIKDDKLTLWLPPLDENWKHVVFYGNGSTTEEALAKYDIDDARYIERRASSHQTQLSALISRLSSIEGAKQHHYMIEKLSEFSSETGTKLFSHVLSIGPEQSVSDSFLRQAMDECRIIKDEHEIELIRKANDITAAAHINVLKGMPFFTNESQVEAAYMQVCIAQRAKEQAYDPIAGSGPNAAILHYATNDAEFGCGQTLVLDAGCEVQCYASDVTRTLPINSTHPGTWPSKEAEEVYKLVEKVQESCIKQMRPERRYLETYWHSCHMMITGLLKLGVLKGDPDEIFHSGTSLAFYPHGLGHHVGLDVHDVSQLPPSMHNLPDVILRLRDAYVQWKPESAGLAASLTRLEHFALGPHCYLFVQNAFPYALEPGMVVTIEPGLYFNDFLLKQTLQNPQQSKFINNEMLKRYRKVGGVRIEDDILITKKGYENLTTAPKGNAMLKIIQDASKSARAICTGLTI